MPLESTLNDTSPEAISELNNLVRMTYESGNIFEGRMTEWIPHGTGHLYLKANGVTYKVTSRSFTNRRNALYNIYLKLIASLNS